jgi:hypothetical protein
MDPFTLEGEKNFLHGIARGGRVFRHGAGF